MRVIGESAVAKTDVEISIGRAEVDPATVVPTILLRDGDDPAAAAGLFLLVKGRALARLWLRNNA